VSLFMNGLIACLCERTYVSMKQWYSSTSRRDLIMSKFLCWSMLPTRLACFLD
jgi:hypothetical protein